MLKKFLVTLAALASLTLGGLVFLNHQINSPLAPENSAIQMFQIPQGSSATQIANKLSEENLISSALFFRLHLKRNSLENQIIAGSYSLSPSMTPFEIAKKITTLEKAEITLTIKEGESSMDIDAKLSQLELIQSGEYIAALKNFNNYETFSFLNETTQKSLPIPLEGYLFPDTYFLNKNSFTAESLIQTQLKTFERKALPRIQENNTQIHEIITMASIIEKEATGEKDGYKISDILWRRVEDGWFLGADATSLYLKNSREITKETLQEQNPYNTRNFQKGLPPGPIANPGIESINFTLNPEKNTYWYYLHDPKGTTHYALDNAGHNANRAKYLRKP
jgi:UPF0755 protein